LNNAWETPYKNVFIVEDDTGVQSIGGLNPDFCVLFEKPGVINDKDQEFALYQYSPDIDTITWASLAQRSSYYAYPFTTVSAERTNNRVRIEVDVAHDLVAGDVITVSGMTESTYNGTWVCATGTTGTDIYYDTTTYTSEANAGDTGGSVYKLNSDLAKPIDKKLTHKPISIYYNNSSVYLYEARNKHVLSYANDKTSSAYDGYEKEVTGLSKGGFYISNTKVVKSDDETKFYDFGVGAVLRKVQQLNYDDTNDMLVFVLTSTGLKILNYNTSTGFSIFSGASADGITYTDPLDFSIVYREEESGWGGVVSILVIDKISTTASGQLVQAYYTFSDIATATVSGVDTEKKVISANIDWNNYYRIETPVMDIATDRQSAWHPVEAQNIAAPHRAKGASAPPR